MTIGTVTTIEAEDFTLSGGYEQKNFNDASGGGYVQTWSSGSLTTEFTGEAGTYSFDMTVFDENDGKSEFSVFVNGELVQEFKLVFDEGGNYIHDTSKTLSIAGLELEPGDVIEIQGVRDQGEPARIDKIDLTQTGIAGAETEVLLMEGFNSGWNVAASNDVDSSDFVGHNGAAVTNGQYDGQIVFREVDMSGLDNGLLMLDLQTHAHCAYFEDSTSCYYDYLRIEVSIDGGGFMLLDDFEVDFESQVFYGKNTGQSFGDDGSTLTYALPAGASTAQIRIVSHLTANNEVIKLDNVKITADNSPEPIVLSIDAIDDTVTLGEMQDVTADGTATEIGDAPKSLNILDNDDLGGGTLGVDTAIVSVGAADTDPSDGGAPTQADGANVGSAFTVTTEGGRTGTVTVQADGTLLFDGGDSFAELLDGDSDSFQLEYTIERTVGTPGSTSHVGFELPKGTIVSDQFAGVSIAAFRANNPSAGNQAMVFDSANPTGGDSDLATSNLGGVLIISEDNDSGDPDDNASGGTFVFDFDAPSDIGSLTFLDTEEPQPIVRLFDENGNQIGSDILGPVTVDGGQGVADINVAGVSQMTITLQGSGAIDNLEFTTPGDVETVSDTAVVTVVIEGEGQEIVLLPPVAQDDLIITDDQTDVEGVNIITAINTGAAETTLGEDTDADAPQSELRVDSANGVALLDTGEVSFVVDNGQGQSGTVTVDSLGNVTFSGAQGFDSLDDDTAEFSFDYQVIDASGLVDTAQVTIRVTDTPDAPTPRSIDITGTVQSSASASSQAIAVIVDLSASLSTLPGVGGDLNADGAANGADSLIAGVLELASDLVSNGRGDQELVIIPTTGTGTLAPITATAAELDAIDFTQVAADLLGGVANPLIDNALVQSIFSIQPDGLQASIDFEQGLIAARDALSDGNGGLAADSNEIIVLTATDGRTFDFAELDEGTGDFFSSDPDFVAADDIPALFPVDPATGLPTPIDPDLFEDDILTSDPTAIVAELTGAGADIDVVAIDPGANLLPGLLDLVEGPTGDGAIIGGAPLGLIDLLEEPTSTGVDAVEEFTVAVNGVAVDGIDASDLVLDGTTFSFADTLDVVDGDEVTFTFVTDGVDVDGDGDFTSTVSQTVDAATDQIEFAINIDPDSLSSTLV